jgi:predicted GH43/DUF377 family glycosyl hydrolase
MSLFERSFENPILVPENDLPWEAEGAFNGSVVSGGKKTHLLYRAQSIPLLHDDGPWLSMSSIGYSESEDGIHFKTHRPLFEPTEEWERFGCEDPRVTELDGKYYVFYTALSTFPFGPDGIKVGVAITKNFKKIIEKHPVTPFNAKAMALFPEKIDGKYWAILTANTDLPPATIAVAAFDQESDLWDEEKWNRWYDRLDENALPLQRAPEDHIELGAAPVKTKAGWLVFYSYIQNYLSDKPTFSIEAVLLDLKNPRKIVGKTSAPLVVPEEEYEMYGKVPNIVFPSGAFVKGDRIHLYYGAADTTTCVAVGSLSNLLRELQTKPEDRPTFERYEGNPVLEPIAENEWESKAVFNPAALYKDGKTYLFYRAMSGDDTSVFGYAESRDGYKISKRLPYPAYVPREAFEMKAAPGNSGCEDARFTEIDDTLYMTYTAVNAAEPPRVALTTIPTKDFLAKKFGNFSSPVIISPPGHDDKDACLFPEKIGGRYVILHRIQPSIDINTFDELDFDGTHFLTHNPFVFPRKGMWDSAKVGISSVPIKTDKGWILLYHGVSEDDHRYRVGVLLLDLKNPEKILARSRYPLFEPVEPYEKEGIVPNVVFPCGSIIRGGKLYIYYGAADKVVGVATMTCKKLFEHLGSSGSCNAK